MVNDQNAYVFLYYARGRSIYGEAVLWVARIGGG